MEAFLRSLNQDSKIALAHAQLGREFVLNIMAWPHYGRSAPFRIRRCFKSTPIRTQCGHAIVHEGKIGSSKRRDSKAVSNCPYSYMCGQSDYKGGWKRPRGPGPGRLPSRIPTDFYQSYMYIFLQ